MLTNVMMATVQANARAHRWAADACQRIIDRAAPFVARSDAELWGWMFGATLPRSWMVLSNGDCPACGGDVPMYAWRADALAQPWKLACPHCGALFPTNDFAAYHQSGLDAHGVFDPTLADRSLLVHPEHPDPSDPKHTFGVDDGHGFTSGDRTYRFAATYLIYGHWKQLIVAGVSALADAYSVTGEVVYAHKAGVLLDRVADLYPTFDFGAQGILYERSADTGYVSTWHDACAEHQDLATAYQQVRDAMLDDPELIAYLAEQARRHGLDNPKASPADVRRNIDDRLLRDALNHPDKIRCNYPRTLIALVATHAALDDPASEASIQALFDEMLDRSTAVDGVTGEKGLTAYSAYVIQGLAEALARFNRARPGFLAAMLERHPRLKRTWRFHIDTWHRGRLYPNVGDAGGVGLTVTDYCGVRFDAAPSLRPSMDRFLWDLYQATGDRAYVQVMALARGGDPSLMMRDLFTAPDEAQAIRRETARIVREDGPLPEVGHVNLQQWRLAILRGGAGERAHATWLAYDTGGGHGHSNGLNLGLFARDRDLIPDLGYPPVQFGGWGSPKASWYRHPAAHHTVVVDGWLPRNPHEPIVGATELWLPGRDVSAMRAAGAAMITEASASDEERGKRRFERTVVDVSLPDGDFYLVDVFRVAGGRDHARFLHAGLATLETGGLALTDAEPYDPALPMRSFQADAAPEPGWWACFTLAPHDPPEPAPIRLRYADFTHSASAGTCEGWVSLGAYNQTEQGWIPRVMTRRQASDTGEPLRSTFVSVIEVHADQRALRDAARLDVRYDPASEADDAGAGASEQDAHAAVEVTHPAGERELILLRDPTRPGRLTQAGWNVATDAELLVARLDASGELAGLTLAHGSWARIGDVELGLGDAALTGHVELIFTATGAQLVTGQARSIVSLTRGGAPWAIQD